MKQTPIDSNQLGDTTHSFVVRMWQEASGNWHGTIRHVQSGRQQGFTKLEQVKGFMERVASVQTAPTHAAHLGSPAPRRWLRLDVALNKRARTMLAMAAMILLMALVLAASVRGVHLDALKAFMGP